MAVKTETKKRWVFLDQVAKTHIIIFICLGSQKKVGPRFSSIFDPSSCVKSYAVLRMCNSSWCSNPKLLFGVSPILPAPHCSIQPDNKRRFDLFIDTPRVLLELFSPIHSTAHHLNQVVLEANQVVHFGLYVIVEARRGKQGMPFVNFDTVQTDYAETDRSNSFRLLQLVQRWFDLFVDTQSAHFWKSFRQFTKPIRYSSSQ
jgi:hypothetical protein